jgi:hypothetical protein
MRVTGVKPEWDTGRRQQIHHEFTFDVPPDCHLQFDASQSTLIVKNQHGHTLLAIKQVQQYVVDAIEVQWGTKEDLAGTISELQTQVKQLQSQLTFQQTLNQTDKE